ncbi:hypothetical protein ACVRZD_10040 [Streptococcus hongkongensis]|nr:hypothetical protein NC01_09160 [Streptococcus uberis]
MTESSNNINKIKVSVTKHWKKLAIVGASVAIIGAAGVGGYEYYDHQQDIKQEQAELTKDLTQSGALLKTYSEWHQVITGSQLSNAKKTSFIKAVEAHKSDIDKLAAEKTKTEAIYKNTFGTFESDYTKLTTSHDSLWKKLDANFSGFVPLSDLSSQDIDSLKEAISSSSLSDDEKKTLNADADKMLDLSKKWTAAYPNYSKEVLTLKNNIEKQSKVVLNELTSEKLSVKEIGNTVGIRESHNRHDDDNDDHHRHNKNDHNMNRDRKGKKDN